MMPRRTSFLTAFPTHGLHITRDVDTEASLLPGTNSFATTTDQESEGFRFAEHPRVLRTAGSVLLRPSGGLSWTA
jgi:hypothetical protein